MQQRYKIFLFFSFLLFSFYVLAFKVKADTFTENFDSYADGSSLGGQGGWTEILSADLNITNDQSFTANNSLRNQNGSGPGESKHSVTVSGNYYIDFYFRIENEAFNNKIRIFENPAVSNNQLIRIDAFTTSFRFYDGSTYQVLDYENYDTWNYGRIEVDLENQQIRAWVNLSGYTSWYPWQGTDLVTLEEVSVQMWEGSTQNIYIDDFEVGPLVPPPSLPTFTAPTSGSSILAGDYNFQGACVENGTNRLALTDGSIQPAFESDFTIDCTSNAWSATSTALVGFNQKNLFDIDWLTGSHSTTSAYVFYTGIAATTTPELCADSGFWCELFQVVFIPSDNVLELYQDNIIPIFETKKPFSYFYEITDRIASTTIASTTLQLDWVIDVGVASVTLDFFDSENSYFKQITDPLRPYLVWAIWLLFMFGIIERIMHLDL